MKDPNIMMAKELLLLQIQQLELMIEDNMLKRRVLVIDKELGLNNAEWCGRHNQKLLIKLEVYLGIVADYKMSMNVFAKAEQEASEQLKKAHIQCKETDEAIQNNTVNPIFTGDDDHDMKEDELPLHKAHEDIDETEIINDSIVSESKENVLQDKSVHH